MLPAFASSMSAQVVVVDSSFAGFGVVYAVCTLLVAVAVVDIAVVGHVLVTLATVKVKLPLVADLEAAVAAGLAGWAAYFVLKLAWQLPFYCSRPMYTLVGLKIPCRL